MSDQKIKAARGKAPLGLVPVPSLLGPARVFEYGARKYAPGNFHSATLEDGAGQRYISAALRHLGAMQEPNGLHTDDSLGARDEESGLPHIDHAICGLLMLRAILVKDDVLEGDPGEGRDPSPPQIPDRTKCTLTSCLCGTCKFAGGKRPQNTACDEWGQYTNIQKGDCSTLTDNGEQDPHWRASACASCENFYGLK